MPLNDTVHQVTERIRARSRTARTAYPRAHGSGRRRGPRARSSLLRQPCACLRRQPDADKTRQAEGTAGNLGIVTAYNDMLRPTSLRGFSGADPRGGPAGGGTAQVAGGVPAMCDGVTQGQPGMELSLFSRDVIALAAGVALSHNCFDAAIFLGVCDKIVPARDRGGHLRPIPAIFAPADP